MPLASDTFGGLSETRRKSFKKLALLSDDRGFQPPGLSVAFNRLTQEVSISAKRGSASMMIARDSRLTIRNDGDCRIQLRRYAQ